MMEVINEYVFSVFFVETLLNGLLYGGVLALLSLGLNSDLRRDRRCVDLLCGARDARHVYDLLHACPLWRPADPIQRHLRADGGFAGLRVCTA